MSSEQAQLDLSQREGRPSLQSRRPIATPSDTAGDVDPSLIQETHTVPMLLTDKNANQIENEGDKGQFQ